MVDMVTKNQEKEISVQYNRIRHDRGDTTKIRLTDERKTFRFVFDKRILCDDSTTIPFGYKK